MYENNTNILSEKGVVIHNHLQKIGADQAKKEILEGLNSDPKYISPKFFYDKKGSKLFEEITHLEEYYPTRTEKSILSSIVSKLNLDLTNIDIVELGSGDASKISLILKQIPDHILATINYLAVDISKNAIENSAATIYHNFNLNSITGIITDFHHNLKLIPYENKRLFCFLGSTIGNFSQQELVKFTNQLHQSMRKGDFLLLGLDIIKDIDILEDAYNDNKGITAQFNKNILSVVNSIIGSNFHEDNFDHLAYYNSDKNRIEMHLKANCDQNISLNGMPNKIHIDKGETIHTENSYKFDKNGISMICQLSGLKIRSIFADDESWFNIVFAEKE